VPDLAALIDPRRTAVVTMEMQRGVVGDLASIVELATAVAEHGLIGDVARLLHGARRADVTVVHATVSWRADRRGTSLRSPMAAALARNPGQILHGTDAAELVSELGPAESDLISHRGSGFTPFTGTNLDAILRASGIETVIATGVSLNVGVLGLVLSAVDLGYRVVVPTDAVVGVPAHYATEVLHHTIAPLAHLSSIGHILEVWASR